MLMPSLWRPAPAEPKRVMTFPFKGQANLPFERDGGAGRRTLLLRAETFAFLEVVRFNGFDADDFFLGTAYDGTCIQDVTVCCFAVTIAPGKDKTCPG